MKIKHTWLNHLFNFLAVILGVYLAFYINERALLNREIKESHVLMNSLVSDLSEDIKAYEEYQIPENIRLQEDLNKLLELLLKDNLEGIGDELSAVFQVENFNPTTSTYSSMKSSGKLKLIDDLALQKELSDYYEGVVPESINKGEFQVDYFTEELLTWLTSNVDLAEMKLLKEDELVELRNKLIIYESLIDQKVNSYKLLVEDSKKLKKSIESIFQSK